MGPALRGDVPPAAPTGSHQPPSVSAKASRGSTRSFQSASKTSSRRCSQWSGVECELCRFCDLLAVIVHLLVVMLRADMPKAFHSKAQGRPELRDGRTPGLINK